MSIQNVYGIFKLFDHCWSDFSKWILNWQTIELLTHIFSNVKAFEVWIFEKNSELKSNRAYDSIIFKMIKLLRFEFPECSIFFGLNSKKLWSFWILNWQINRAFNSYIFKIIEFLRHESECFSILFWIFKIDSLLEKQLGLSLISFLMIKLMSFELSKCFNFFVLNFQNEFELESNRTFDS